MNRLVEIGFVNVGRWVLSRDRLDLELTDLKKEKDILYAFVSGSDVKYIGKTTQTLERRLYDYKSPGPTQSTNIKCNANILQSLKSGGSVEIWALADTRHQYVGEFRLNLAAGLEDDMIAQINPPWNGGSRKSKETITLEKELRPNSNIRKSRIDQDTRCGEFAFILRKTYYEQGFFNVGVEFGDLFAQHGSEIEIRCGEKRTLIVRRINRTANLNGTPRIMGGRDLKYWIQNNLNVHETVNVRVSSPKSIWIF